MILVSHIAQLYPEPYTKVLPRAQYKGLYREPFVKGSTKNPLWMLYAVK